MFSAGASGMMIGDFLTTPNRGPEDDLRMLEELGLSPYGCGTAHPERIELAPRPRTRLPVVA